MLLKFERGRYVKSMWWFMIFFEVALTIEEALKKIKEACDDSEV